MARNALWNVSESVPGWSVEYAQCLVHSCQSMGFHLMNKIELINDL